MPYRSAWVMTKVKGKNMPQKKQNAPATVRTNLGSFSGRRKFRIWNGFLWCTSLDLRVRMEMDSKNRIRNAQIRIAHANPTSEITCDTMMGRMTPPRLDPAAVTPNAKARRFANHVLTELTDALKMALAPRGLQMPCERINW